MDLRPFFIESKLVGSSLPAMKKTIAAIVIAGAAVLLLASLKNDNRIAPGKRTEGLCPPFCESTERYVEVARRNQAIIEADMSRFHEPIHAGGRTE